MEHGDLSSWLCIWLIWYILVIIIVVISFIIAITHLLVTSLPGEVGLVEYVCTHPFIVMFLAIDLEYVLEEFE
jgi:hypothetical protein